MRRRLTKVFLPRRRKLHNAGQQRRRPSLGRRRKGRLAFLLPGLCLLAAQPALAGWRYTTWTMTPAEVVEASSGKAELLDPPVEIPSGLLNSAAGQYNTGIFIFNVYFLFRADDEVLEHVVLNLKDNTPASQLYQGLVATYGEPYKTDIKAIQDGESHTAKWKDPDNNNLITYFGIGDNYSIEYAPLNRTSDGF